MPQGHALVECGRGGMNQGVVVTEAGSYVRLMDSCITQLEAQGPSRTCNESQGEEEKKVWGGTAFEGP